MFEITVRAMHFYLLAVFWAIVGTLAADDDLGEAGDFCDNGRGICSKLSDCPAAIKGLQSGLTPKICSFDNSIPIVCCHTQTNIPTNPPSTFPSSSGGVLWPGEPLPGSAPAVPLSVPATSKSVSKRMCEKYAKYVFSEQQLPVLTFEPQTTTVNECGVVGETLIVGGTDAKIKEFPHMVQIGYGNEPRIAWLCGGSLISERYVLSAAHCTKPESKGPARWARLGDLDTLSNQDRAPSEILKIVERTNHPKYNNVQLYNDIALYKLERDIVLNPYIRPICLQVDFEVPQDRGIATGWGHTRWGGRPTNKLQKVGLNVVDNQSCNKSYRASVGRQLPKGIDDTVMLCAGDEQGKDTCQGDSGGPLQVRLEEPYCTYSQIGVTSFGRGCAENYPGVYTRVSAFIPWIESIVWPNQ